MVIFAGYQKQMEDVLSYNEGLPSRFPLVFNFADYSDEELFMMLMGLIERGEWRSRAGAISSFSWICDP